MRCSRGERPSEEVRPATRPQYATASAAVEQGKALEREFDPPAASEPGGLRVGRTAGHCAPEKREVARCLLAAPTRSRPDTEAHVATAGVCILERIKIAGTGIGDSTVESGGAYRYDRKERR
jgi:hypothetical protein